MPFWVIEREVVELSTKECPPFNQDYQLAGKWDSKAGNGKYMLLRVGCRSLITAFDRQDDDTLCLSQSISCHAQNSP